MKQAWLCARRLASVALQLLSGSPVHGQWGWRELVLERCKATGLVDPTSIASLVM